MKYKIFTFAFVLLSCTSNLPDNESTVFEELDTSRPLTTSVKSTGETEDVLVGETSNSTLNTTVVDEGTTTTTLSPMVVEQRFLEILSRVSSTEYVDLDAEGNGLFKKDFPFTYQNKDYVVSYNFETSNTYCDYFDYTDRNSALKDKNVFFLKIQHSKINEDSIKLTYSCRPDSGTSLELYFDYIFKVDNQCYIYKKVNPVEHFSSVVNNEDLLIIKEYTKLNSTNSVFLYPEKIYYSGDLNKDCEKSTGAVNVLNQTDELGFEINSLDLCCENIINPDTGQPFGGHYLVRYRTLTEFEYCRDEINNIVHNFAEEFEFWEYFPGEYLDQTITLEISVFSNLNNFLIKLDINSNIAHLPGGVMWYYDDIFTYILDGSCSVISSPGNSVNLFAPSNKLNLTAIATHVVQQYEAWVEEFEWFLEAIPENIYIDYKYDNERVVFDLTNMFFWENFSTNSFNCKTVYQIYNYDNFFAMPTWNYYRPVELHANIYELSKVSKINLPLDKFSKCENFQT